MSARRRGRACGTSRWFSAVGAQRAARPFALRKHSPAALLLIGLLLLTGAILAAAPAARADLPAAPTYTTIAGGAGQSGASDGTGTAARFYEPISMAIDPDGNVFIADIWNSVIRKMTPAGVVTTVAGSSDRTWADGAGSAARFNCAASICYSETDDCFYIADTYNSCIRKMTRDYVVTTIAGLHGTTGSADGTGTAARFNNPGGIACDGDGVLYVADSFSNTVRRVTSAGVVTTLAGSAGASGTANGAGAAARFNHPNGVAVDGDGTVYVADYFNHAVRRITPAGMVTTLAGSAGTRGSADGAGSAARFKNPWSLGCDPQGNVFVADGGNYTYRKVTPAGVTTTVGGLAGSRGSTDGAGSAARFYYPYAIVFGADGIAYVGDANWVVRRVTGAAEPAPDTQTWTGLGLDGLWSNPANWDTNTAPASGDSLVFAGTIGLANTNDISGLSIKDVTFSSTGFTITGQAVTLSGAFACPVAGSTTTWGVDTTLGGDVTVSMPAGWLNVTGDVSLGAGADGHKLTATTSGFMEFRGAVSGGASGGTSLVKAGAGSLSLKGVGTWTGGLSVQGGSVYFYHADALAGGSDVPVSIAAGACISSQVGAGVGTTWDNVFSGAGTIYLSSGRVALGGASPDFTGTVSVSEQATLTGTLGGVWELWATLRGTGTLGDLRLQYLYGATLQPGLADYATGRLTATAATLTDGAYVVDVADAAGTAGTGWDDVLATGAGGVSVTASASQPVTLRLRSSNGSAAADAANFDPAQAYRWPVVSASAGTVAGFSADKFTLETSGFSNALQGGRFSLEQSADGTSIDIVFTPGQPPVAGFGDALACGSGYLTAPNSPSVAFSGSASYSVQMWVRPHAGAVNDTTLMRQRDGGPGTEETWLAITSDYELFGGIQNLSHPGWLFFGFDHALPLDRWSHVAFVKTSSTVNLYIDGELADTEAYGWPHDAGAASAAPLTFGGDDLEGNHLPGDLDEIQVYDRALTSEELAATYNRGLGQALSGGSGPVRYYELNEAGGAAAADSGSDAVDATLTGMAASPWIASRAAREFTTSGAAAPVALAYGDADTAALTVSVVDQPAHGTVDLTEPALGRGTYTPADGWSGSETFTYQVSDGHQTSDPQTAWVADTGPDTHVWDGGGADDDWSTAANWAGDEAPKDGDTVRFAGATRQSNTNDLLTTVGGVEFATGGWLISGDPFSTTGPVTSEAAAGTTRIQQAVTLAADAAVTSAADGRLNLVQLHLSDGVTGHGLTVGGAGTVSLLGIDGAGAECSVTKTGEGITYLTGPSSFGGAVDIEGGALWLLDTQALPSGAPVSIAANAMLFVQSAGGNKVFTLDNPLSGGKNAYLVVYKDTLRLTGDSSGFTGSVQPVDGATLRVDGIIGGSVYPRQTIVCGSGVVGRLQLSDQSSLSPGPGEYAAARLTAAGNVELMGDSSTRIDVSDAEGEAGTGYDNLETGGSTGLIVGSTSGWRHTIVLRSSDGSQTAAAQNFDPTRHYRWHIMTATAGAVRNFSADVFTLDAAAFTNDLQGGSFALDTSADGTSLDVVFTPAHPNTHVWSGLSLTGDQWSHRFNWLCGVAPSDGDDLDFIGLLRQENVNDSLSTVGSVRFWNHGFTVSGDPVVMEGTLRSDAGFWSNSWQAPTTAGADLTIQSDCGTLDVGPLHLVEGTTGHSLTVAGGGSTTLGGDVDGADAACSLTKKGSGALELFGTNTFGGAVDVQAGAVTASGAAAVPAGVPVGLAADTTLSVTTRGKDGGAGTWDNVLSGSGTLRVELDHLRLTADSPGFLGLAYVDGGTLVMDGALGSPHGIQPVNGGTVGGDGSVQSLVVSGGNTVWPGVVDLAPASLSAGSLELGQAGAGVFAVGDAAAAAGTGYDTVSGESAVATGTSERPFQVSLVSVADGAQGACANWDPDEPRRWHVVQADDVVGFSADEFSLDTAQFAEQNELSGGAFALEQGTDGAQTTIDVVFTPVAGFSGGPSVGAGGDSFAKGSRQTVAWEMDAAPPAGSVFKVVADDPASATDVLLATVPATSATRYGYDWTIAQGPSAGWHVTVQLWSGEGDTSTRYRTADSQDFDILAASHTVTVTAGAHGSITPGTGSVTTYSDQTYTITPDTGYHVSDVKVDDVSQGAITSYKLEDVRKDHTISATFAVDTFTIEPSVVGGASGHGSISPSTDQTVDYGGTPTFAFVADTGYHVEEVMVDGDVVTMSGADEYTFPAVTDDHSISAAFAIDTFTVKASVVGGAAGHGTISPSGDETVEYGSTPAFTFAPDTGYGISLVRVDGVVVALSSSSYTFDAVTEDHTITVAYAIHQYSIDSSVVGDASGHGTISPAGKNTVDHGATPAFSFAPDAGYHVAEVLVDGDEVAMTSPDEYTFPAVTDDHTISVEFAVDSFEITVTAGAHGGITPGTGQVEYGVSATYTVTPDEGYHIVDVLADDESLGATGSVTFKDVAAAHTLSATFAVDTFTITPSVVGAPSGHGAISPSTPQTVDWHGTPRFTFTPDAGYEVAEVQVDGQAVSMTGTDEYEFPAVTAGHTISVSFRIRTFAITVTAGEHGSVTPGTDTVEWGGTPAYAITPGEGFRVAEVLVDGTSVGAVTSYQFTPVQAAHTLEASFVALGMPSTTVSGASGRWSRRPVTLTFAGHPGEGGTPVAYTEYKLGDGEWVPGGSVTVRTQGATRVWYRSVDTAGAVQDPPGRCLVRIDTRKPKVVARSLRARPSQTTRLRYKVKDLLPTSGSALVRCVVRNKAGKVMTRSSSVPVGVNKWLKLRISTWAIHAPGAYTIELRAKDRAGNWQQGSTRVRLTIR